MSLSPEPGVPLIKVHRDYLLDQGIHADFLAEPHIVESLRSVTKLEELPEEFRSQVNTSAPGGILFRWQSPADPKTETWQFRPDSPIYNDSGREMKYVFPYRKGMTGTLRSAKSDGSILVAVEGTKQGLAVASALRDLTDYTVASFPGAHGWGKGGRLSAEWLALSRNKTKTYIILDADAASNPAVYNGGTRFKVALGGGRNVKFVSVPGEGTEGIDDYLSQLEDAARAQFLIDLIRTAAPKPAPKAPPRHAVSDEDVSLSGAETDNGDDSPADGKGFFDPINGSINPVTVVTALMERNELALDLQTLSVYLYDEDSGVYTPSIGSICNGDGLDGTDTDLVVSSLLMELLGDRYASAQEPTITKALKVKLIKANRIIQQEASSPLIHFRNGWLDPFNPGIMLPHSPDRPSTFVFNVDYDPDAACPEIQDFLNTSTRLSDGSTQTAFIFDALSQLMDWQTLPTKMLWLAGKPRAGKGTLQRLLEAIVPTRMTSAVSLHALEDDPFARANLYGALLNVVGEADQKGLSNPKVAKEATGGDWIHANPKYARQFKFRNRAFWVLAANDLPTVNDPSGALHARTMPTLWEHSHTGKEDPALLDRLMKELPGFVNLILDAFVARKERGGRFLDTSPLVDDAFKAQMNPVFRFVSEEMEVTPEEHFISANTVEKGWGTTISDVFTTYKAYTEERGYSITRNRDSLEKQLAGLGIKGVGGSEVREAGARRRVVACRLKRRPTGIVNGGREIFTENPAPTSEPAPTPLAVTYTPHPACPCLHGAVEYTIAIGTSKPLDAYTNAEIDALAEYAELDAELDRLWAIGALSPETRSPIAGVDPLLTTTTTASDLPQIDDPVLSRINGATWDLLRQRGRRYNPPAPPEAPQPPAPYDPHNSFSVTAWETYRQQVAEHEARAVNPLHRLESDLAQLPSTVSLEEVADALEMPILHARAYLRAANTSLANAGITVRERRLGVARTPGSDIAMFPAFVGKKEREDMKKAAKTFDALVKRHATRLEREIAKLPKMRTRAAALKKDDAAAKQLVAVGDQLTTIADLQIALDAATALAAQDRPDTSHLDALLATHTGYAVALTH
jgi:putative DNA primase/helicase